MKTLPAMNMFPAQEICHENWGERDPHVGRNTHITRNWADKHAGAFKEALGLVRRNDLLPVARDCETVS